MRSARAAQSHPPISYRPTLRPCGATRSYRNKQHPSLQDVTWKILRNHGSSPPPGFSPSCFTGVSSQNISTFYQLKSFRYSPASRAGNLWPARMHFRMDRIFPQNANTFKRRILHTGNPYLNASLPEAASFLAYHTVFFIITSGGICENTRSDVQTQIQ
jgi:hypothetical protein